MKEKALNDFSVKVLFFMSKMCIPRSDV